VSSQSTTTNDKRQTTNNHHRRNLRDHHCSVWIVHGGFNVVTGLRQTFHDPTVVGHSDTTSVKTRFREMDSYGGLVKLVGEVGWWVLVGGFWLV
jgi:hypothetical protein